MQPPPEVSKIITKVHIQKEKYTVDQQLSVKSSSQLNNLLRVQINEVKLPTLLQKEKNISAFLPSILPSFPLFMFLSDHSNTC